MVASKDEQKSSFPSSIHPWELYLILTKFRENQEPSIASIKFRDFERKLELKCIEFRNFFFYSSICSFDLRTVKT